jgi:hypothetical protein
MFFVLSLIIPTIVGAADNPMFYIAVVNPNAVPIVRGETT